MSNGLTNAAFLDGASGWTASSGASIAVDEATRGAPGRAVAVVTGAASAAGQTVAIAAAAAQRIAVVQRGLLEVQAGLWSSSGASQLAVAFYSSGGALVSRTPLRPAQLSRSTAKRGRMSRFDRYFAKVTVPQTGTAALECSAVARSAGSLELDVLKPFMATDAGRPWPTTFDPGAHLNVDLQLPCWPSTLRPFQNTSNPQPIGNARSFSTDSGIPVREDLYTGLRYAFKAQLRTTQDELDDLEQFYEQQRDEFYVVDPFTDRVCIAEWSADGAPSFQDDQGETAIYQVGLQVRVA